MNLSIQIKKLGIAFIGALLLAVITFFSFDIIVSVLNIESKLVATLFVFISSLTAAMIAICLKSCRRAKVDSKTLYVGNLPYRANDAVIRELFAKYGHVYSVRLMKDHVTGKRRGFGFIEMASADAQAAITALNDSEFQDRTLKVREAKDKTKEVD